MSDGGYTKICTRDDLDLSKMPDTTKSKPDGYKLTSAGRHLQREADVIDESVEKNKNDLTLSVIAMMKVESHNLREVGDWLVELGESNA